MIRQVVLTFHPNQANPARAGGLGVWRVLTSLTVHPSMNVPPIRVAAPTLLAKNKTLRLLTAKAYKPRSRVDPEKLALEYRRAA